MMNLFCFMTSLFSMILGVIFIRKRSLEFNGGLLWILLSLISMIFSINSTIAEPFARALEMHAPEFLLIMDIVFSLIMIFHLMILVSDIQRKLTRLIQENSILKSRIEEMSSTR